MPNKYTEQRIVDSNKKVLIKLTGILDTEMSNTVLINTQSLAFALNTNNQIMVANTDPKPAYRVVVKRVYGDVNLSGYMSLQWHGTSNTEFLVIGPTTFDFGEINIPNNEANTNGSILASTKGVGANSSYTIFVELIKDARDYDRGQTADPYAFNNKGPFP